MLSPGPVYSRSNLSARGTASLPRRVVERRQRRDWLHPSRRALIRPRRSSPASAGRAPLYFHDPRGTAGTMPSEGRLHTAGDRDHRRPHRGIGRPRPGGLSGADARPRAERHHHARPAPQERGHRERMTLGLCEEVCKNRVGVLPLTLATILDTSIGSGWCGREDSNLHWLPN